MKVGWGVLSLWLVTGAVTLAAVGITGTRAAQTRRNAAAAQAQLLSVQSQAERLIALRSSDGEIASTPGPLAQRVPSEHDCQDWAFQRLPQRLHRNRSVSRSDHPVPGSCIHGGVVLGHRRR